MPRPISALIDPGALARNLAVVRLSLQRAQSGSSPSVGVWAVIKADAYGHGVELAVAGFAAADGLAMLDFSEAERCRAAGWRKPLLMLEGAFESRDLETTDALGLTLVLHHKHQLRMLQLARPRQPIDIYLKLQTGMNRLGFSAKEYAAVFRDLLDLRASGQVGKVSHMTHFACADQPDGIDAPMRRFTDVVKGLPGDWSVCNSAATLQHAARVSALAGPTPTWVRPGICLYGGSPFADRSAQMMGLSASMTLRSVLISVHDVIAGEGIGYGYITRAVRNMRVGVVACGYADGYPRHAPVGTPVVVRGTRVPVVGRVSMDMLTVDVSALPSVEPGDEVILWGRGGPCVDEVATLSQTISYELLSAVTARVPRAFASQSS